MTFTKLEKILGAIGIAGGLFLGLDENVLERSYTSYVLAATAAATLISTGSMMYHTIDFPNKREDKKKINLS